MSVILVHPTANSFVREATSGLLQANLLHSFYTSIASFPGTFLHMLSGIGLFSDIKRRSFDSIIQSYTHQWPWKETGRLLSIRLGITGQMIHEKGMFSVDAVYRSLDKYVSRRLPRLANEGAGALYTYEDGAFYSFLQAKKVGIRCLYDLPIGYWRSMREMLDAERDLHPQWAETITGFNDSDEKLARKDKELQLSDHIFVASSFTASTLKDYPGQLAPVSVIPYGFPDVIHSRCYDRMYKRPLRLLFVGGLSQRKGIANLFKAVEFFKGKVELTIVGYKVIENCIALNTALARHKWIPSLPHNEILQLMRKHDVLVFPSLYEGFGMVITEAMSQGTPVITTERTAGPDILIDNENGWLIKAGDTTALKSAIENLLLHPQQIENVGRAAMKTALVRPWYLYGQELASKILKLQ